MTGREAYEADCAAHPTYHNGTPRPTWDELPPQVQHKWNEDQPKTMTGPECRAARVALGWTLRDTARRLGYVSDNSVREIEAGKMRLTPARATFVEAWMEWDARRAEWMRRNPPPPDKCSA